MSSIVADRARGPLAGLTVLDLTRVLSGPYCTMQLADMGARVIKIEHPEGGDDTRHWGPPFLNGESTYFLSINRNKESVTLDFKTPGGRAVLDRLMSHADVLVENFRPGTLARQGLDYASLSARYPRLIYASLSGYGHTGPRAQEPGYDAVLQGEGGLMSLTGVGEPTKVGVPIADLLAGMNLAYGVLAALHERMRTGRGRVVRTSLLAGVVGVHAFQGTRWTIAGAVPGLSGSHHPAIAPYGMFASATSPVQVAVGSEGLWQKFAPAIGLDASDPRFTTNRERVAHRDALVAEIEAVFATEPAEHWLALLLGVGIPAGKVRSLDDVYSWDQTRSQGLLVDVDHPAYGPLTLAGSPIRFEDNPYSGGRPDHRPPPLLDEHGDAIREWLDS